MDVHGWLKKPAKLISYFENNKIPFWYYIATFFSLIMMRQLLESFSQRDKVFNLPSFAVAETMYHYTLAYIAICLMLTIFIHYAAREPAMKICRVVFPAAILLLIAPIVDLLLTWGGGVNMTYIEPVSGVSLWRSYLTVGDKSQIQSIGIRVELIILLAVFFMYFRVKNINLIQSLIYAWLCYTLIFIWGAAPFVISAFLYVLHFSTKASVMLMINYFLIVDFMFGLWFCYLLDRNIFMATMRGINIQRTLFFMLSLLFGLALGMRAQYTSAFNTIYARQEITLYITYGLMSIFFFAIYSFVISVISDNKLYQRSTLANIDISLLKIITLIAMSLALFYASFIDAKATLLIASVISITFLHEFLPLQLKSIPVISGLAMSVSALMLILLGYLVVQQTMFEFPLSLFVIYLVGVTLMANDVAAWGLVRARLSALITGAIAFLVFISFYMVIPDARLLPVMVAIGGVSFYLSVSSAKNDAKITALFNAALLAMSIYLVI